MNTHTTDEQALRIAIARYLGIDRWALMSHGLYYRNGANGYTPNLSQARIVTENVANDYTRPNDTIPITKHPACPDYLNDPAAALLLVDQLPGTVTITRPFFGEWRCEVATVSGPHFEVAAPTFPLAVAKAFARANDLPH